MDVLSTLTKYTQENLDEEIKELCKNYPQYRFYALLQNNDNFTTNRK